MKMQILAVGFLAVSMTGVAGARVPVQARASITCFNLEDNNATVQTSTDNRFVEYTINPGGDPRNIELQFVDAQRIHLNISGKLLIVMTSGETREYDPVFYQMVNGKKKLVAGGFRVLGANRAAFTVGKYDQSQPLLIEAVVKARAHFEG